MNCHTFDLLYSGWIRQLQKSAPVTGFDGRVCVVNRLVHNPKVIVRRIKSLIAKDSEIGEIDYISQDKNPKQDLIFILYYEIKHG